MFLSGLVSLLSLLSVPLFAVTVQSTICHPLTRPVLESSVTTTTDSVQIINGSTSQSVLVSIFDNNQPVATVTSDSLGGFSIQVSLAVGNNDFTAISTDECSSMSTISPLVINRAAIPVTQATTPFEPSSVPDMSTSGVSKDVSGVDVSNSGAANSLSSQKVAATPPGGDKTKQAFTLKIITPAGSQSTTTGTGDNLKTTITTTDQSVYLKGITRPSAQVTISDNSHEVAQTTAAYDGSFGILIPLSDGTNILTIEASLAGNVTTQILYYVRKPEVNSFLSTQVIIGFIIIIMISIAFIVRRRNQHLRFKR